MHQTAYDIEIMTRTVYGEARGEPEEGRKAVAHVILNRAHSPIFREHFPSQVCLARKQFSCWNKGDPNYLAIRRLTTLDPLYMTIRKQVQEAVSEKDFTKGALWYHTKAVSPYWSRGATPCFQSGPHLFYNELG